MSPSILSLSVQMHSNEAPTVRGWLGSALRGAFGTKLLELAAADRSMTKAAEILFNTANETKSDLCVNPYLFRNCFFENGALFFEMILFGHGIECLNEVCEVLRGGLEIGAARTRFSLDIIRDSITGMTPSVFAPYPYQLGSELTVKLISPLCVKSDARQIDFDYLIRACTRRITSVWRECGIDFDMDFDSFFIPAKEVTLISCDISQIGFRRFSNRTGRYTDITGYMGELVFQGLFEPYERILSYSEWFGIGKWCVMGLGQIRLCGSLQ